MKILYVSQYFPPEMGAPAARVAELSRHWARQGHEVTVLTGFPNHPTGKIAPEYRSRFRRLVMRERMDGVNVARTWLFPLPNRKAHERILSYGSFCLSSASTGMFLPRPDVVIATSPQLLVGLSGWWIAHCKRAPFVLEVRDLWPESLAAVGMGDENSVLHGALAKIAGFLYRRSDHVVVVSPAFKNYLVRHWHMPPEKISVVENGVETDLFKPQNTNADLRKKLGAEGTFVVCYAGTIGMAHGLDMLIEAADCLQRSAPEILFLLVGEGADKNRIMSLARSRGLANLRFVDQQLHEKMPNYICAADACLVLLKKTDLFKTVIPTKMLEFMSCGRPVILGVEGEARAIIEEAEAGIAIEPENASDLARAVIRLASDAGLRESFGRNGRRYIVERLSRHNTAETYIRLLERLTGRTSLQALAA